MKKNATIRNVLIGLCCLAVIGSWQFLLSPHLLSLPDNLTLSTRVESFDNFYDPLKGQYSGEQRSVSTFSYTTTEEKEGVLTVDNTFDVQTLSGEPIFHITRTYTVNARTGTLTDTGTGEIHTGYLFAPRMKGLASQAPDKSPFIYWHVNYDTPATMVYQGNETLDGLDVYHYQANFIANQTQELTNVLPGVGLDKGVSLNVALQLWVEPYTGRIIKYRDDTEAFFYDLKTGVRLYPWNKFHNQTAPDAIAAQAKVASVLKEKFLLLEYGVPVFLFIIGIFVIVSRLFVNTVRKILDNRTQKPLLPFYSASAIFVFTLLVANVVVNISEQRTQADFVVAQGKTLSSIANHLAVYANMLKGGRRLFDASSEVNRQEWKMYVDDLDIERNFPGVRGIGFAKVVTPETLPAYLATVRADGFPDFTVTPDGTRSTMTPVTYLEPFDERNQRAFGYDLWSESTRQTGMAYARDIDDTGITGKVTLRQENGIDEQAGFLMFEPVYDSTQPTADVKERRAAIFGYVYAPFRVKDLMRGIFATDPTTIGVEIYDAATPDQMDQSHLLFQSVDTPQHPKYTNLERLHLYNRTWIFRFTAAPSFDADPVRDLLPLIIVVAGALIALITFFLVKTLNTRGEKARALAEQITADLKKSRDELRLSKQQTEEKLTETERLNNVMINRELKMIELKKEIASMKATYEQKHQRNPRT